MAGTPLIEEGPVRGASLEQAVQVAVRAFDDDPFFGWLFPEPEHRHRSLARLHRAVLVHLASIATCRTARLDDRVVGAAVWVPPGRWPYPPLVQLRQLFAGIWAFLPDLSTLARAGRILRSVESSHPRTPPHWYLQLLMVDPDVQRQGIGALLQAPELAICDKEGVPAWLETQKEENLAYYGRFGFEVVKAHHPVADGPTMWSLRREPAG